MRSNESLATIDKQSHIPIYRQIHSQIKQLILNGQFKPHDMLPSENELAQSYDISVMTVRQAMKELVNEGLVYRIRGRGTFVASEPIVHSLQRFESFSEHITAQGLIPSSKIIIFKYINVPKKIAPALALPLGEKILRIKRLRLANNCPVGIHDVYLRDLDFDRAVLEDYGSLYELLEDRGLVLAIQKEILEAVPADTEASELLDVPLGSPLIKGSSITYLDSGQPLEFVKAIYRTDRYRYSIMLNR